MTMLLRVNSKFKKSLETDADFSYDLVSSQAVASVTSISLIQATVNRLFTNINHSNNTISYMNGSSVITNLTIPVKQYTIEELITALNLLYTWTWTLGTDKKLYIENTGLPIILLASSTVAQYIGLTTNISLIPGDPTFPKAMQTFPQLQGPDEIYVQSSILAAGQCLDDIYNTGGSIPLLGIIPCGSVPYGYSINWHSNETSQYTIYSENGTPNQLKRLFIQLTDKYGNLLNLPPLCHVDLLFRLTYA